MLGTALGNFAAGLLLGLPTSAASTRLVVDVAQANFGFLAAALVLYCSVVMPAVGSGVALAARVGALAVVAVVAPTLAALAGIAYQCWSGHGELQMALYGASLYVGMGWHLLHFGALAAAVQAFVASQRRPTSPWLGSARRWAGAGATVALYLGSRLFDHVLLRFGTPMWSLSDVDGYAHVLYWQVAVGIYWTGFCALLLALARLFLRPRRGHPWRRPMRRMTPNLVAVGWGGFLVWAIAGTWIATKTVPAGSPDAAGEANASMPQPVLSSLDVQVDVYPEQRVVASRGAAVVVNRLDESVPELRIGIPPGLTISHTALTGELTRRSEDALHYRLNRPLEPAETLRVDFEASLALAAAPTARRAAPSSASFLRSADVLPNIGYALSASADSAPSQDIAFRARISTTVDRIAVAPGQLVRHWKQEGRSYYDYQTQQGVPPLVYIHSARYAVTRQQWQGVSIEAYHLPAHGANATRLIDAAKDHLEGKPKPYPWLRVVEVADYEALARAPGLLAFGWRTDSQRPSFVPLGGVLPYSELRGFYR